MNNYNAQTEYLLMQWPLYMQNLGFTRSWLLLTFANWKYSEINLPAPKSSDKFESFNFHLSLSSIYCTTTGKVNQVNPIIQSIDKILNIIFFFLEAWTLSFGAKVLVRLDMREIVWIVASPSKDARWRRKSKMPYEIIYV